MKTRAFKQLGSGPAFHNTLCDLLEKVQILTDFQRREVETLAAFVGAYRVTPHTSIFTEGGKDNFLCFLVEGRVEVLKQQTETEQRQLATVRPGRTIGEMAFLDRQPHSATVVATGEAIILLLTEESFEQLSEEHPRLALKLLQRVARLLSHRLRQTSGQLIDYL